MKSKDYYQILGVDRNADAEDIKQAYRLLARKFHPDVTKDAKGEEKFKEIAAAYATLKDAYKRKEYDNLEHKQEEERRQYDAWMQQEILRQQDVWKQKASASAAPPPQQQPSKNQSFFSDVDFSDIFSGFSRNRKGGKQREDRQREDKQRVDGMDYEITTSVSIEQIFHGEEIDVKANVPEVDKDGTPCHVTRTFRVRIPTGAVSGQRLRLSGKGGAGKNGGKPGDLYIVLNVTQHPLYRISGSDLYMDLPLAPWEAVLGSEVKIPTLAGPVELNIKSGTTAGQQLRLPKRGLPSTGGSNGDLFAIIRVVAPKKITSREQQLYQQLATVSEFNPRQHFNLLR